MNIIRKLKINNIHPITLTEKEKSLLYFMSKELSNLEMNICNDDVITYSKNGKWVFDLYKYSDQMIPLIDFSSVTIIPVLQNEFDIPSSELFDFIIFFLKYDSYLDKNKKYHIYFSTLSALTRYTIHE